MTKTKIATVVAEIVDLLEPFSSEERRRIIKATMALLGEISEERSISHGASRAEPQDSEDDSNAQRFPQQAKTWMRKNGVTSEHLENTFNIENGKVEIIASEIPGKGDKGKTINAYILEGIKHLLSSGEVSFEDKSARMLCKHLGCNNEANHAGYLKSLGNKLSGSKKNGWKLNAPGLTQGAILVKEMSAVAT